MLRRAVELGVTLIDTADSYGPPVSERLIREALRPYPDDLVIATKAGLRRPGPGRWERNGEPEYLKAQAEKSLRLLGLERIELFHLHRIDPKIPLADQLGALLELQAEGRIGRIGLSEVSVPEVQAARAITPTATVQNLYNLSDRSAEPVLDYCEREDIGFIPWFRISTSPTANSSCSSARPGPGHRQPCECWPGSPAHDCGGEHGASLSRLPVYTKRSAPPESSRRPKCWTWRPISRASRKLFPAVNASA